MTTPTIRSLTSNHDAAMAMAKSFREDADALTKTLDAMPEHERAAFIILVSDLPMKVWTVGTTPHCEWVNLHNATRYSDRREAARKASTIVNGLGEVGVAVEVRTAYLASITELRTMADKIAK